MTAPNHFESGPIEMNLLCVHCRKRLGNGRHCVESDQPIMGRPKKPAVWHVECFYDTARRADTGHTPTGGESNG
jgi:hypothetical protein